MCGNYDNNVRPIYRCEIMITMLGLFIVVT